MVAYLLLRFFSFITRYFNTICIRVPCSSRWPADSLGKWLCESTSDQSSHRLGHHCPSCETTQWQTVPGHRRRWLPARTRKHTLKGLSLRHLRSSRLHRSSSGSVYVLEKRLRGTRERLVVIRFSTVSEIVGIGHVHL